MNPKLTIVLVIAFILLIVGNAVLYNAWRNERERSTNAESIIVTLRNEIKYTTSKSGKEVATSQVATITKDQKDLVPEIHKTAKDIGVKDRNVKAFAKVVTERKTVITADEMTEILNKSDTSKNWESGTAVIHLVTKNNTLDLDSTGTLTITRNDTTKYLLTVKRKWLFGKEHYFLSTTNSDPNAKVISQELVLVGERRKPLRVFGSGVVTGVVVVLILIVVL